MNQTLEMVTFRTLPDVTEAAILAAVETTNTWLQRQQGFAYRTVSHDGAGMWIDQIWWDTAEDAQAANKAWPTAPESQAYMGLIDGPSVTMQHLTTLANVPPADAKAA